MEVVRLKRDEGTRFARVYCKVKPGTHIYLTPDVNSIIDTIVDENLVLTLYHPVDVGELGQWYHLCTYLINDSERCGYIRESDISIRTPNIDECAAKVIVDYFNEDRIVVDTDDAQADNQLHHIW